MQIGFTYHVFFTVWSKKHATAVERWKIHGLSGEAVTVLFLTGRSHEIFSVHCTLLDKSRPA
jgi:hypothetical protein